MIIRRSAVIKYLLAFYLGVALYCEWFVYVAQSQYWPKLECSREDDTCTKILFVADPQIQGYNFAPPPFNYIFNLDSDRYLKSTFNVVENYFKPDMVIYLGDLMDEGSVSTSEEFQIYVRRLAKIFEMKRPVTQVWVPGDNDIGGENEPVKMDKLDQFQKAFEQPDIISLRNISVIKINGIVRTSPEESENMRPFTIIVSHYPLTNNLFGRQVNEQDNEYIDFTDASKKFVTNYLYFCAHAHESKYVRQTTQFDHRETIPLKEGADILNISFTGEFMYEIYVPTCSYRMGTRHIGYGVALMENNNANMRYTVLWSPPRFPYLLGYLVLSVAPALYLIMFYAARLFYNQHKALYDNHRYDKLPLI